LCFDVIQDLVNDDWVSDVSDLDSDIEAQKLLQHANVATTRKHYRLKGSITKPAQGFSMVSNDRKDT
jgi:hypothetical protein